MPRRNHHASGKGNTQPPVRGGVAELDDLTGGAIASAGNKADEMAASVGEGMRSVAGGLRGNAPAQPAVEKAAHSAADALDRTGRYLQEEGMSGFASDVVTLVRRNPLPVVLAAVGLGFLVAHTFRRR